MKAQVSPITDVYSNIDNGSENVGVTVGVLLGLIVGVTVGAFIMVKGINRGDFVEVIYGVFCAGALGFLGFVIGGVIGEWFDGRFRGGKK